MAWVLGFWEGGSTSFGTLVSSVDFIHQTNNRAWSLHRYFRVVDIIKLQNQLTGLSQLRSDEI
jgi:hypothetical protein